MLTFTHISEYKYKFIKSTLCVGVFLDTDHAQVCSYARLINEALGVKPGNSGCEVITSPCHPFSPSEGVTLQTHFQTFILPPRQNCCCLAQLFTHKNSRKTLRKEHI